MKRVLKYGTGQPIPEGAIYLHTLKNGRMGGMTDRDKDYVWHYFLVEEETQ